MTEQFALQYAETRRRQVGALAFDVQLRHLALQPAETRDFPAQGDMWLLTSADKGVFVESDTGQYYVQSDTLRENVHEHTGQLRIANKAPAIVQVQFVVITWIYPPPDPATVPQAVVPGRSIAKTTGNGDKNAPFASI